MERHICSCCGGELQRNNSTFDCPYCGAAFEDDYEEKASITLRGLLDEVKLERLSNARKNLYDASHQKYPSKEAVINASNVVLQINPDDFMGRMYLYSHDMDPIRLNTLLANARCSSSEAKEVLNWLLPSLQPRSVGSIRDFAERHFKNEERTKWMSKIEEEAAKVFEGIYVTTLPRDVFLAYSSVDMPKVIETLDIIEENGFECFAAFRNLRHGKGAAENYLQGIESALKSCKVFVFLSSDASRSATCDAMRVELPYLIANFPDMPRIEYILSDYPEHMPRLVKKTLKEAFPEQEHCRDEDDLIDRIEASIKGLATKKVAQKTEPVTIETKTSENITPVSKAPAKEPGKKEELTGVQKTIKDAEKGDAESQFVLGWYYEMGKNVPQNYLEAAKWYRKAAEQGHVKAQYNLALLYAYGRGVAQNYEEAAKWYRKAAEQGHAKSQCNLGLLYEDGKGVAQNYAEASKWYRKAAEQGYASSQYNLGVLYKTGRGVAQNYAEASKWYLKAAEQGHVKAQNNLGVLYKTGRGVAQSYEEAVKWFSKAAKQGHASSQCNLGCCYDAGTGVAQNYEQAVKWYLEAASQGEEYSMNNLGICYEKGKGVKKDINEAISWYRKAAAKGHEGAKKNLERLKVK